MTLVTTLCLAVLAAAAASCVVRLVRPGSTADRIVALDTLLVITVMAIAVLGVRLGIGAFAPVALVAALLGFVGTVMVARFVERRGA